MSQPPNWIFNQSGVIPYRIWNGKIKVMLITSRKRKRWVIPKGIIEPSMSPPESAVQEAWEEAGLVGQVSDSAVGNYEYQKWGGTCHVEVFLLAVEKVLGDWPEAGMRDREWLSIKEASKRVKEEALKQMIIALPDLIE